MRRMNRQTLAVLLCQALFIPSLFAQGPGGLDRAEAVGPFLNGTLPSRAPRPSTGSWRLVNAYPGLTFIDPIEMRPVPFSNRILVAEKAGRLTVFENDPAVSSKTVLLDIRHQVESSHDSGLLGYAFHPEFGVPSSPNRHYLYVYYRYTPQKSDTQRAYCRLSRFTWDPATDSIARASEFVLINQYDRHNWHNGGGIFFDEDGFLYLSIGDEGGANDQFNSGQRMDNGLLAGVLRIDVDRDPSRSHPIRRQPRNPATPPAGWPNSYSQGYYIPNDNPWQSPDGSQLEEFFAIGLRSPHRMTQDPVTGEIWVGDVGQGAREEISLVPRGGNLQWPYREGNLAGPKAKPSNLIGFDVPPVHDYGRSVGVCVIGGYVYRGALHPELVGKYLFGDHGSGRIWSLDRSGGNVTVNTLLTLSKHGPGPKNGMASFGLDASGEIYVLSLAGTDLDGGRIYRLEKTTEGVPEPPRLLSQTTAFADLEALEPSPGLIPYAVNQPLWSDGSDKRRWIAIPNDGTPDTPAERILWSEEGAWGFPVGTVLVKHFEFPARRLETRFLVNGDDGEWYGFTYRWREDGSDAELLPEEALEETVESGAGPLVWRFPGRGECFQCHTQASGRILGVKTSQLNGDYFYEATGRSANQLVTLNRLGFLSPSLDESSLPAMLKARPQDDESVSLERRARSYLDVNCAHCHQPAAATQAGFDLRLTTPPWYQSLVNVEPGNPLGIPGASLVAPGRPDLSVLHARVASTDEGVAMPPIAKSLADAEGLELLERWIASIDPAVSPSGPLPGPPPSDHAAPLLTLSRSEDGGPLVDGPFDITVSSSKPVFGLGAGDFEVINGSVAALSGSGQSWTLTVVPTAAGPGLVSLGADRVVDAAGNANNADTSPFAFEFLPPSDLPEQLANGGFENGLDGWDGGGDFAPSSLARSGSGAARLGSESHLVQILAATPGEAIALTGAYFTEIVDQPVQTGFSFWDADGNWISERYLALPPSNFYAAFLVDTMVPEGAVAVGIWALSGSGSAAIFDDFVFFRLDEAPASLVGLVLSNGTLSPAFSPDTTAYSGGVVGNALASLTVTPSATHSNATVAVRVNGGAYLPATSGSASEALPLQVGINLVEVRVTAEDGETVQVYSVEVVRRSDAPAPPQLFEPDGGGALFQSSGGVILSWTPDERANWHEIYISKDGSLYLQQWVTGAPKTDGDGNAVFNFNAAELPPGDYQWWVRSYAPVTGTGSWSAPGSFRVECEPLEPPPMPGGQTELAGHWPLSLEVEGFETSATWAQFEILQGGASFKQLWVALAERGRAASYDPQTGKGDSAFAILPDGAYQWRARTWSSCYGSSEWSSPQDLSISGTACAGSLPAAAAGQIAIDLAHGFSGAVGAGTNPVAIVSPGMVPPATWYQLWIDAADGGEPVVAKWYSYADVYDPGGGAGGSYRLEAGQYLAPGDYLAYVQGYNECGHGAWSAAKPFTVEAPASLEVTGIDVAFDGDGALRVLWNGLPGVTWYQVWVGSDGTSVFDRWLDGDSGGGGYLGRVDASGQAEFRGPLDSGVHAHGIYAFWIRAYLAGGAYGPWASATGTSPVDLAAVPVLEPTVEIEGGRPRIRWNAATAAGGYEIYLTRDGALYHRESLLPDDLAWDEASRTWAGSPPTEYRPYWEPLSGSYQMWVRVQGGTRFGPWSAPVGFVLP